MAMMRYKLCPDCGARVDASLVQCPDCDYDMSTVEIMEEPEGGTAAPAAGEEPAKAERSPAEMVLVCSECGAVNPASARKCVRCREDLSDLLPVPRPDVQAAPAGEASGGEGGAMATEAPAPAALTYELVSLDGAYRLELAAPETVVGRDLAMRAYLKDKLYVGRRQARFFLADGMVQVESLGQTNPTFVNDEEIDPGVRVPLTPGDEIGLGGAVIGGERQALAAYFVLQVKA